jgi:hypothetical protein
MPWIKCQDCGCSCMPALEGPVAGIPLCCPCSEKRLALLVPGVGAGSIAVMSAGEIKALADYALARWRAVAQETVDRGFV